MAPMQWQPVMNQAPTRGDGQNAYLNLAQTYGYSPQDPAAAQGLGQPQVGAPPPGTLSSIPADEAELQRQAEMEQMARMPYSPLSSPPDEGLGLASQGSAMPVSMSSGNGGQNDFSWLGAIGGAMQSGGAAWQGNYSVPQQYFQLHQQRQQMLAQAEEKKQAFAQQQAKLAEDKKNHQWTQVFQTLSNEHIGAAQRVEVLKGMKDNPYAAEAAQSVNAKMIGDFKAAGEFLPRKPEEYMQAMKDGKMDWHQVAAETKMGLKLREQVAEKQASTMAYQTLERMAKEQPDNPAIQEAWMEAKAEKQKKIADSNVAVASAPSEIRNNQLKPDLTQAHIDESGRDKSTINKLAEDLQGKPWKDLTQAEKHQVMAYEQSREIEKQEAGARAREQVKVESSLAPGVMMLDTLSKLTEKPGMFVSEKEGTWQRLKQMGTSRYEAAKGTEEFRLWKQMSDGMRATLARMAMEVGNLAATEQDRALHLIADPFGGMHGLPDTVEVARKKHALLGEFLKAGLEGPQGPDGQSRVQARLKGILDKLDTEAPLPSVGDVSPAEENMIKSMQAEGKSKRTIQAAILQQRGGK